MAAAGANVIMQLSQLLVGHGVAKSRDRRMPAPIRSFPFNLYRWDTRRRMQTGKPIV